ncbi:unnamed protein product [Strongylus vulgaris]|uniref:BPTI/Kunitz inhibitor domain-containing protein n=1 Tax=Strongylus vulgaris TaxID=40348 RepID=A0A3P7LGG6_STRVU|nr:unnamed protein product [Strongylus vulgaris]
MVIQSSLNEFTKSYVLSVVYNLVSSALPNPCTAPPRNPGDGPHHATRWAFDGNIRKCVPFEYRGLHGNANNFLTREDCEQRCPGWKDYCKEQNRAD